MFRGRARVTEDDRLYINQEDIIAYLDDVQEMLMLCGLEADPISLVAMISRQLGTQTQV